MDDRFRLAAVASLALACAGVVDCASPARAPEAAAVARGPAAPARAPQRTATGTAPAPPPPTHVEPAPPPAPKVVLHLGDSMVGGYGGLTRALEGKFKELGSRWVKDWQEGVGIATFDREHRMDDLLAKNNPDLVILTLGANDVTLPFPAAVAPHVRSLAHKMSAGGRECYWMLPPLWRKDTGIIDVIRQNASPCKVFDATGLKIERARDGIHPNDQGGIEWADAFFAFYRGTPMLTAQVGDPRPAEVAAPH
jgi:lysophospholipase L1-like esterase